MLNRKGDRLRDLINDDRAPEIETEKLVEESTELQPPDLRLLQECCCDSVMVRDDYREKTFDEKIRTAVNQIQYAVQDEAFKGIGDDGRTLKRTDYSKGEPSHYDAVGQALNKRVNVNMFKDLVPMAKRILEGYLE